MEIKDVVLKLRRLLHPLRLRQNFSRLKRIHTSVILRLAEESFCALQRKFLSKKQSKQKSPRFLIAGF